MTDRMAEQTAGASTRPAMDSPQQPAGFSRLARTITRRTTDLLVIGIVSLAFLNMGRQVSEWWRTDAEDLTARPVSAASFHWDDPAGMLLDLRALSCSLRHQRLQGDAESMRGTLIERCQGLMRDHSDGGDAGAARTDDLLKRVTSLSPDWTGQHGEMVYVIDGPCLLAVGTRPVSNSLDVKHSTGNDRTLAGLVLAFPAGDGQWAVFTIKPLSSARDASAGSNDFPLPSGARPSLTLQDGAGNVLLGFEGDGPVAAWRDEITRGLMAQGWQPLGDWQGHAAHSALGFVRSDNRPSQMDIQLLGREDGCSGLVHISGSGEAVLP